VKMPVSSQGISPPPPTCRGALTFSTVFTRSHHHFTSPHPAALRSILPLNNYKVAITVLLRRNSGTMCTGHSRSDVSGASPSARPSPPAALAACYSGAAKQSDGSSSRSRYVELWMISCSTRNCVVAFRDVQCLRTGSRSQSLQLERTTVD
jgi:hypothetical protein